MRKGYRLTIELKNHGPVRLGWWAPTRFLIKGCAPMISTLEPFFCPIWLDKMWTTNALKCSKLQNTCYRCTPIYKKSYYHVNMTPGRCLYDMIKRLRSRTHDMDFASTEFSYLVIHLPWKGKKTVWRIKKQHAKIFCPGRLTIGPASTGTLTFYGSRDW